MPIRKPAQPLLNPPLTTIPPDLLDALVSIFGDSPEVTAWATPLLVRHWRYGAIAAVQWDGLRYVPLSDVGDEMTYSITGYGLVCELRRAMHQQHQAERYHQKAHLQAAQVTLRMLASAIGKPKARVAA